MPFHALHYHGQGVDVDKATIRDIAAAYASECKVSNLNAT